MSTDKLHHANAVVCILIEKNHSEEGEKRLITLALILAFSAFIGFLAYREIKNDPNYQKREARKAKAERTQDSSAPTTSAFSGEKTAEESGNKKMPVWATVLIILAALAVGVFLNTEAGTFFIYFAAIIVAIILLIAWLR